MTDTPAIEADFPVEQRDQIRRAWLEQRLATLQQQYQQTKINRSTTESSLDERLAQVNSAAESGTRAVRAEVQAQLDQADAQLAALARAYDDAKSQLAEVD